MSRPNLIIMAGPPAAGKTTSAPLIARELGIPLFAIDEIKERLAEAIGISSLEFPDRLGDAAMTQTIAIAKELLMAGQSVMLEGFIRHGESEQHLAPLVELANAVLVHLRADDLVLNARYENRAVLPDRHWIHGDVARIGTLLPQLPPDMAAPLDLGVSRIFVDTTNGTIPARELVRLIREALLVRDTRDYIPIGMASDS